MEQQTENKCPMTNRQRWQERGPILREMQEAFNPLCAVAAECVEQKLGEILQQDIKERPGLYNPPSPPLTLPGGDFYSLSPLVFGEHPIIPHELNEATLLKYTDEYLLNKRTSEFKIINSFRSGSEKAYVEQSLRDAQECTFDAAKWQMYWDAHRKEAEAGATTLDGLSAQRDVGLHTIWGRSIRTLPCADRLVYTTNTNFGQPNVLPLQTLTLLPVGEYGEEFTYELAHATGFIQGITAELSSQASSAYQNHAEILDVYATRVRTDVIAERTLTPVGGVLAAVQEGQLSIAQSASMLMATKVEGYDDPYELLEAIAEQELIAKFTRLAPPGLLGPAALQGRFLPVKLENHNGELRFSREFVAWAKDLREKIKPYFDEAFTKGEPEMLGLVCPAVDGIARLTHTLQKAVEVTHAVRVDQKLVV